jgi:hypothetical protein
MTANFKSFDGPVPFHVIHNYFMNSVVQDDPELVALYLTKLEEFIDLRDVLDYALEYHSTRVAKFLITHEKMVLDLRPAKNSHVSIARREGLYDLIELMWDQHDADMKELMEEGANFLSEALENITSPEFAR